MASTRFLNHGSAFRYQYENDSFVSFLSFHSHGGSPIQRTLSSSLNAEHCRQSVACSSKKIVSMANRTSLPQHLKRRTRSGIDLDCDLHRRYENNSFVPFLSFHSHGRSQIQRTLSSSINAGHCRRSVAFSSKKIVSMANRTSLPEYLKRRTRSGIDFDRDLHRRYASSDHVPAMLCEVLEVFRLSRLRSFVDCTLGVAGHSSAIIESHKEMELFVGLDVDPLAIEKARARIEGLRDEFCKELKAQTLVMNFKHIKTVLDDIDENLLSGVDGIFMDLGVSSMQVNYSERGFSILNDGPLDMRMDPLVMVKAEDILNSWPKSEVGRVLRDYGEEDNWQFLQEKIMIARKRGGLHFTAELVELIQKFCRKSGGRKGWIKTATRVFQALRIAVNDELQTLKNALHACFDRLSSGGRLAVISFHSLEDRIVKKTFLEMIENGNEEKIEDDDIIEKVGTEAQIWCKPKIVGRKGTILTKRPITPSETEENVNRRCRSAKLRVIQKH